MLYSSSWCLTEPKSLGENYVSLLDTAHLNLLNELVGISVLFMFSKRRRDLGESHACVSISACN